MLSSLGHCASRAGRASSCCDQEKPIRKLAELVRDNRKHDTVLLTPVGSSASAGASSEQNQEVAKQCRERRKKCTQSSFQLDVTTSSFSPWLVRQAAWLITQLQIKADDKTPDERLHNRAYHGEVVEFAETVHHKDNAKDVGKMDDTWHVGLWSLAREAHLSSTSSAPVPESSDAGRSGAAGERRGGRPGYWTSLTGRSNRCNRSA